MMHFSSDFFKNLETRRWEIQEYANGRYSWAKVAAITAGIYSEILANCVRSDLHPKSNEISSQTVAVDVNPL